MTEYLLDLATPADADDIVRIVNGAYRGQNGTAGWTSEAGLIAGQRTDATQVERLIGAGNPTVLVMRDGDTGRIVATVCADRLAADRTELGMLSVDVAWQGGGAGKRLIALTEAWLRERGVTVASMTVVHARTELIAWYGRQGYLPNGETVAFPYDDPAVGRPLRDDLYFVVLEKRL
ncbi:GNAT family N-acetyltransferase [Cupriavidus plantarum]|uniref:GNAT family N-acetyltransferase n=1 Tax=Cupriavidus plantarum TaxID=942865 RepID=UPI000E259B41|nr:GNAT family N-acetyltransferase [Cupriavidus plantarum]NYI01944.1 putative N-acetyltransferase YhbS [Cupriavidus plantarum]REE91250.1 putative N-acetyltransferase YhbS [Cupriavidus plantarum]